MDARWWCTTGFTGLNLTLISPRQFIHSLRGGGLQTPDIGYPADNHKLGWSEMLAWLRQKRRQCMSFGGVVYLVLLVPVVNLLMMPAALAGATLFWGRERGERPWLAGRRTALRPTHPLETFL
jgi:hypothetical protein